MIQNVLNVKKLLLEGADALRETHTEPTGEGWLVVFKDNSSWPSAADGWIIGICRNQA